MLQLRVRVEMEAMSTNGYTEFPKAPKLVEPPQKID